MREDLIGTQHLEKPLIVVANLNRPNIYIEKNRRKPASANEESFESILLPIAKELKEINSLPTYHHLPSSKVVWVCIQAFYGGTGKIKATSLLKKESQETLYLLNTIPHKLKT